MNAVRAPVARVPRAPVPPVAPGTGQAPRLALLGTGPVGRAFVARSLRLHAAGLPVPAFAWIANSRACTACDLAGGADAALAQVSQAVRAGVPGDASEGLGRGDVLVDATACDAVADRHAAWLARGIHVVTANKLGAGAGLARARAIADAARGARGGRYGDGATVGAGLPLLRAVRALVAGGDRIHAVEGLLSGSLGWLFDAFDGSRRFSALVAEAGARGFTEPDPRCDLSGEDVRRKLLILARAAGHPLHADAVAVASLVPAWLARRASEDVPAGLRRLDAAMARRVRGVHARGERLRVVGRFDATSADVTLRALPRDHPLCGGHGPDNRVAIWSDRYADQPLVIQGPGAGAGVTAAALLDDVLACVA